MKDAECRSGRFYMFFTASSLIDEPAEPLLFLSSSSRNVRSALGRRIAPSLRLRSTDTNIKRGALCGLRASSYPCVRGWRSSDANVERAVVRTLRVRHRQSAERVQARMYRGESGKFGRRVGQLFYLALQSTSNNAMMQAHLILPPLDGGTSPQPQSGPESLLCSANAVSPSCVSSPSVSASSPLPSRISGAFPSA